MFRYAPRGLIAHYTIPTNQSEPGAALPFSLNQTGTLLPRHLAQFVSAIDRRPEMERKKRIEIIGKFGYWRSILNSAPEAGALPDCATLRHL